MKTLTLKKLSTAVLAATCILGVGIAQATPKVSITITTPKGTSGANAAAQKFYKDLPWLPCVNDETGFGARYTYASTTATNKVSKLESTDQLVFALSATNEDVVGLTSSTKDGIMDYDLYVFFYDSSAHVYALKAPKPQNGFTGTGNTIVSAKVSGGRTPAGFADFDDTPFLDFQETGLLSLSGSYTGTTVGPQSSYRFLDAAGFKQAAYSTTILGGPIELSQGALKQGMWNVLAVMVSPSVVTDNAAGAIALQNPANWEAWTVKPFIVGTPFATSLGTTVGTSVGAVGTGSCY